MSLHATSFDVGLCIQYWREHRWNVRFGWRYKENVCTKVILNIQGLAPLTISNCEFFPQDLLIGFVLFSQHTVINYFLEHH
jgi:hypothetical protein